MRTVARWRVCSRPIKPTGRTSPTLIGRRWRRRIESGAERSAPFSPEANCIRDLISLEPPLSSNTATRRKIALLAHTLAMVALKKGRPDAIWIAAATLDRYLQNIGKPQIYGTQFQTPNGPGRTTQEPYDRATVSDALRDELDVPALKDQDAQRAGYDQLNGKR